MMELALACDCANANLILAEGEEFTIRVYGKRNACVYVDGYYNLDEEDPAFLDCCYHHTCFAQRPVAIMKRNRALGCFEPASAMREPVRDGSPTMKKGASTGYLASDSKVNMKYVSRMREGGKFNFKIPEETVYKRSGMAGPEKEY